MAFALPWLENHLIDLGFMRRIVHHSFFELTCYLISLVFFTDFAISASRPNGSTTPTVDSTAKSLIAAALHCGERNVGGRLELFLAGESERKSGNPP